MSAAVGCFCSRWLWLSVGGVVISRRCSYRSAAVGCFCCGFNLVA